MSKVIFEFRGNTYRLGRGQSLRLLSWLESSANRLQARNLFEKKCEAYCRPATNKVRLRWDLLQVIFPSGNSFKDWHNMVLQSLTLTGYTSHVETEHESDDPLCVYCCLRSLKANYVTEKKTEMCRSVYVYMYESPRSYKKLTKEDILKLLYRGALQSSHTNWALLIP